MRGQRQIRSIHSKFETRQEEDGKKFISGYFAVFNSNYQIWDEATESIDPHAFDETLGNDVRALIDHQTHLVLGRNKAGTLTLRIDSRGLWGDVEINEDDQDAMNLYARVQRGDVDQCSFGFDIQEEKFEEREDGSVHWTILKVYLYEVSVCTFPAYEDTSVSARKNDLKSIEQRKVDVFKKDLLKKLKGDNQ